MSDPKAFDEHARELQIRQKPRPVSRINRKVLITGAGLAAIGLFTAASIALAPPRLAAPADTDMPVPVTAARKPAGFSALPSGYDTLQVPKLGPPLPGDLGGTILQTERSYGIDASLIETSGTGFLPDPAAEAERARRLKEAALAEEAARAPLFFRLEDRPPADAAQQAPDPVSGLASELLALTQAQRALSPETQAHPGPDRQDPGSAFAAPPRTDIRNPGRIEDPVSPFQLMAGALIPASLVTGLNSDLPGTVIAQVTQNVYDSVRGQYLLIPQGSRLIGRYQSDVSFGQERALIVWDRIVFPDGSSVTISEPGTDAAGYAGLRDRTDHHWDRVFTAAGLATLLGIGAELGSGGEGDIERAIRRGTTDTINEAGQRAVDRSLGVRPSLTVRPGWPVNVIVTRDLVLKPKGD